MRKRIIRLVNVKRVNSMYDNQKADSDYFFRWKVPVPHINRDKWAYKVLDIPSTSMTGSRSLLSVKNLSAQNQGWRSEQLYPFSCPKLRRLFFQLWYLGRVCFDAFQCKMLSKFPRSTRVPLGVDLSVDFQFVQQVLIRGSQLFDFLLYRVYCSRSLGHGEKQRTLAKKGAISLITPRESSYWNRQLRRHAIPLSCCCCSSFLMT